jgi:hypothetical protein
MQKLSLDVDMKDVSPTSTAIVATYGTYTDDELRSPRTPTYVPTSPSFSKVTAFDPTRIFSSPDSTFNETTTPNPQLTEPAKPLAWIWQCHLCKSRYPLSVTRRCLQDGHFYCSGETDRPNLKKKKRSQSCSSEFDYIGWREWGEWKRRALGNLENGVEGNFCAKGCLKCEFPSQCRYVSVRTTSERTVLDEKRNEVPTILPKEEDPDLSLSPTQTKKPRLYLSNSVTFDSILASVKAEQNEGLERQTADLRKDTCRGMHRPTTETTVPKSTSSIIDHLAKSTDSRSSKKSTLSPIAEEFFVKADPGKSSVGGIALLSWNDIVGKGPREDEDWMDLT